MMQIMQVSIENDEALTVKKFPQLKYYLLEFLNLQNLFFVQAYIALCMHFDRTK